MNDRRSAVARSVRALARPWTLLLVVLLLVNDHGLRQPWLRASVPGWVTGKLGDVAWLGFAPLVVAVPLALLSAALPQRRRPSPRSKALEAWLPHAPILLAIALVGVAFGVVNASPAAGTWFGGAFRAVFRWQPLMVSDATDLLTLPALWIAWRLWTTTRVPEGAALAPARRLRRVPGHSGRVARLMGRIADLPQGLLTLLRVPHLPDRTARSASAAHLPRRAWWVLGLAALATLANSGPPDPGMMCIVATEDGRVLAGPDNEYGYTPTFASDDGGLTWVEVAVEVPGQTQVIDPELCARHDASWVLDDAARGRQLRFTRSVGIELSRDGGQTWTESLRLGGSEARQAYYQLTRYSVEGFAGPHDAVVDPTTGNVIATMGNEGLVVLPAGASEWQWVAAGEYRFEAITKPGQVFTLLQKEIGLAVAVACVAVVLSTWALLKGFGRTVGVIAAVATAAIAPGAQPATVSGYGGIIMAGFALGALVLALPMAIVGVIRLVRTDKGALPGVLASGLGAALLYLVPLVLWTLGVIPRYSVAAWIAVVVACVAWMACFARSAGPTARSAGPTARSAGPTARAS